MQIGYALSSEEHSPAHLVRWGERAEAVGFDFALISDHYHPWVDRQGESPFVWCVLLIEQATKSVSEEEIAAAIVCGADPERHLERFHAYADAGYDHVYVHQIGPDQEGFFRFYEERILPALR